MQAPFSHKLRPHELPHWPHIFGWLARFTQAPAQLVVLGSHRATHLPLTQAVPAAQLCMLAIAPFDRSPPQPPQFCESVPVFTHEPLHALRPLPQVSPHAPPAHAACPAPNSGPGHTLPHWPQLVTSVPASTQVLPHRVNPWL